jgi:hypothetical protein
MSESPSLRNYFVHEIPLTADGIFLWTVLVTADIRRHVENEVAEERLLNIMNTIPSRLETLFQYVLNRLDENDRRRIKS